MEKIAVGIVLYNAVLDRFRECLSKIYEQSDKIYIFDNTEKKQDLGFLNEKSITYMTEGINKGIAYALNKIMEKAKSDGYEWVVTMDQDSVIPEGMIDEYKRNLSEKLGIICPQVIDKRRAYMGVIEEPAYEYVNFCITSASCTSIKAWEISGGFDEWLFIDLVDNDFCKRITVCGYKILKINKLILNQEFGKIVPKSERKQQFWVDLSKKLNNKNVAKFSYKKYVSPVRVYYTSRNIIYVNKKLKSYGSVGYVENYNCKGYLGFLLSFSLPSFLRAEKKVAVLKAIVRGTMDGCKAEVRTWEPVTVNTRN